jgi:hypothetical protein
MIIIITGVSIPGLIKFWCWVLVSHILGEKNFKTQNVFIFWNRENIFYANMYKYPAQ